MASTKKNKEADTHEEPALNLWQSGKLKKIAGLVLVLFSFLLFVSFLSYLFSGNNDEALVQEIVIDEFGNEVSRMNEDNALGKFGVYFSNLLLRNLFGLSAFFIVVLLFVYGSNMLFNKKIFKWKKITFHSVFLMFFLAALFEFVRSIIFKNSFFHPGGYVGYYLAGEQGWLQIHLSTIGSAALLLVMGLTYLVIIYNLDFDKLLKVFQKKKEQEVSDDTYVPISMDESIFDKDKLIDETADIIPPKKDYSFTQNNNELELEYEDDTNFEEEEDDEASLDFQIEEVSPFAEQAIYDDGFTDVASRNATKDYEDNLELAINKPTIEKTASHIETLGNYDPTLDLSNYKYPPLSILEDHGGDKVSIDKEELERNKDQIVETLKNYNIEISKIKATVGPTVTLYEIIPAPGVRISKIKNLEDDIALSLAALGIRIIAPIPGKGTIGIEVPNAKKETVSIKSILGSEKFSSTKFELPIALGKNISNEIFIVDLTKMPHLLMAGATGQGKSVGINSILVSLLYKKHPSQLKFVLVDPKKVELSIYNAIEKHFLAILPGEEEAIITDVQKVVATLNALCIEMDDRYNLLKEGKARNLSEYNEKFIQRKLNPNNGHKYLPYIVLVIDEFADLIMTAGKEVETPIARLAQLARAIGIHLILATQRPSVNIITGVIKANFPARISFKVSSKIDSRTILDTGGADQLIGRGDMLFSQGSDMVRLQCAFIDTPEVEALVNFISQQQGYPTVFELPEYFDPNSDKEDRESYNSGERDPLFDDAARVIVNNQVGSTSMIQRRLKLGYNRAGRIMDQLESAGIVGPNLGSKPRDVYFKSEAELEQFLNKQ
jgi:S-DNA-T family DNA segregation ATPase FtsK/SpoIIIE